MGRPRSERQVDRISVSLEHEDYQALKVLAARNDVSAAWLVRRAVTQFLGEAHQEGQGAPALPGARKS